MASLYQVPALSDWWWLSYVEWWAISRVGKKACIDIQHGFGIAIGSISVLLFSGLTFIIPVWAFNLGLILDSVRHSLVTLLTSAGTPVQHGCELIECPFIKGTRTERGGHQSDLHNWVHRFICPDLSVELISWCPKLSSIKRLFIF